MNILTKIEDLRNGYLLINVTGEKATRELARLVEEHDLSGVNRILRSKGEPVRMVPYTHLFQDMTEMIVLDDSIYIRKTG